MQIDSMTWIPMTKESKFEDISAPFEVAGITTDIYVWLQSFDHKEDLTFTGFFNDSCIDFAKKQKAFMTAPTAKFGNIVYGTKTKTVESLDSVVLDGPLYRVEQITAYDITKEKNVLQNYLDENTFEKVFGLYYPIKTSYKIRYGVVI